MGKSTKEGASSTDRKRISAKEAVIAASRYFAEITGIQSGVTVEEVAIAQTGGYWMITLGHPDPGGGLPIVLGGTRRYKELKVDAQSGEVLSMKIREV